MAMKQAVCAGIVAWLVTAVVSDAGTKTGMNELQIQGSFSLQTTDQDDDRNYAASATLIYSYFFAPQVSVGASGMVVGSLHDPEGDSETKSASLFFLGRFDFYLTDGSKPLVPYFGPHGGGVSYTVDNGDETESSVTFAYGGHAGLKFFVGEHTSWNVEGNYTEYRPETDDSDQKLRILQMLVGYSYYF
jgi:hypothetical protein